MKGKHFTTGSLLTNLFGTKTKKSFPTETITQTTAAHSLLLRSRPARKTAGNPVYRSVTACIY